MLQKRKRIRLITLKSTTLANKKVTILLQSLILFIMFVSLFSSIVYIKTLQQANDSLAKQAFLKMDLEIDALQYFHQNDIKHHDAIYMHDHWITYWFKEDKLIINFDGYHSYNLLFDIKEPKKLSNRTIQ